MPDSYALRQHDVNGIDLRVAHAGPDDGPVVLMVHGWPESWFSWRHQITAFAEAGFRVLAPAMRGYDGSTAPPRVDDYDIFHLCDDLAALLEENSIERATVIGHDWGALVAWHFALLHPSRVRAVAGLSVPYGGRARISPIATWQKQYGDEFFYVLYFQETDAFGGGLAEQEFDSDPRALLRRLYVSPDTPRAVPEVTDPARAAGGMTCRLGEPEGLPEWLSEDEFEEFATQFERSGFRGPINWYRNFHRNWEMTPQFEGARLPQPALFVAGAEDQVIRGANAKQLEALLHHGLADLRGVHLLPDVGHWVQQEAPEKVNDLLLDFARQTLTVEPPREAAP